MRRERMVFQGDADTHLKNEIQHFCLKIYDLLFYSHIEITRLF